jgi:signal transduction histidine kinase
VNPTLDGVDRLGLQFFGNITASVSHELKNALAIIGQNAGLLQDYLAMAAKGRVVTPDRFAIIAERIDEQTRRANKIIQYLNRFAHTVDEVRKTIDLNDLLALLELLSARIATMRQATVVYHPAPAPVVAHTAPFALLTLLGRLLWSHLQVCQAGHTLEIGIGSNNGGEIYFEAPAGLAELAEKSFPNTARNALLDELSATVRGDSVTGRIVITLNQPVRPEP